MPLIASLVCAPLRADDSDKKKKPPAEKKEKPDIWIEIRSPHFIVTSDGGEKIARHVLEEFDEMRRAIQLTMPGARQNLGVPIRILAAKDAPAFYKLFPEFPPEKRRPQPNGQFIPGPEKTFIALRTNVSGHWPYEEVYRGYARQIVRRSYRNLPPWLEQGYENIYGTMTFSEKGALLERPDPEDMSTLYESPFLPLDIVIGADRESAYYTDGDKNTVYNAESHALVRFLLSDPEMASAKSLARFVDLVEKGGKSLASAREAFGDLKQLQNRLEAYVKQIKGLPADLPLPGDAESGDAPKTLSQNELDARIGDFWTNRGRREDGQGKLEEVLMADPNMADAEQSLGFLYLQQTQFDDAEEHFSKALSINSSDGLSQYGRGLVAMSRAGLTPSPSVADAFEKCVAALPDFAPAWFNLASVYAARPETLQKALAAARKAAELVPGDQGYQRQLASLQEQIAHPEVARKTSSGAIGNSSAASRSNESATAVNPRRTAPPPPGPANASASTPLEIHDKTGGEANSSTVPARTAPAVSATPVPPPATAGNAAPPSSPVATPDSSAARAFSMIGTITELNCSSAPQLRFTLKSQMIVLHLHADDIARIPFKSSAANAPGKLANCSALRGHTARVTYVFVEGKPWEGEIQDLEFRNPQ